uniref:C-X-C motif chemokine n=1 Tax=Scleropages formosus TaxID=113540 RepID=A0A8C9SBD7_SCLFO
MFHPHATSIYIRTISSFLNSSSELSNLQKKTMRSAVVLLLTCMLLAYVKGVAIAPKGRCLCMDGGVNFIPHRNIANINIYHPSSACNHMEIIVTLKDVAEKKCLNPESRFAQNLIKNFQQNKRSLEKTGA